MAGAEDAPKTITVSRETLRAELAELRVYFQKDLGTLKDWMRDELDKKANARAVEELQTTVARMREDVTRIDTEGSREAQEALLEVKELREGKFTETFRLTLVDIVITALAGKSQNKWTGFQRAAGVLLLLISIGTITLSFVVASHNW